MLTMSAKKKDVTKDLRIRGAGLKGGAMGEREMPQNTTNVPCGGEESILR